MPLFRLDKYLADAGIGTRSQVKSYIKRGFVKVNDSCVTKPDIKIDSIGDIVTFQDDIISLSEFVYYIMNKPAGYVCASKDNLSPTVLSLIENPIKDLFTVGRLDKDTEGLLIITNDGALSHRLLSPKHHVDKTYFAILDKPATYDMIDEFTNGLYIGDEDLDTALPAKLEILKQPFEINNVTQSISANHIDHFGYVTLTIQEGKYHQVKRMFLKKGLKVLYLKRIAFGSLFLPKDLSTGEYRKLTDTELKLLVQHDSL